jgi:hypothetical protein
MEDPLAKGTNGTRDAMGRFVPGHPGGPGNPFGKRYAALRRAFVEATSPRKIKQLEAKLFVLAMEGDTAACKLYLSYALGAPRQQVDVELTETVDWEARMRQAADRLRQRLEIMAQRTALDEATQTLRGAIEDQGAARWLPPTSWQPSGNA